MSLSADILLERTRLKSLVRRWRVLSILAIFAALYFFIQSQQGIDSNGVPPLGSYVARVEVDGIILENDQVKKRLEALAFDKNVKAVIVYINSPGGTMTGSEILYNRLKVVAGQKPVVSVIGSLGASGGYMVALAGEQIFSQQSSLTGSIGVMLQAAEVTELAKKVGVSLHTFKSSPLKGEPSPFSKMTPAVEVSINASIRDSYQQFIDMVKESRKLSGPQLKEVADGRIFTGRQAKKLGLVDHFGDETNALAWLRHKKKVGDGLKIYDYPLTKHETGLDFLFSIFSGDHAMVSSMMHGGVMAVWQPSL
jgi:protease-4